MFRRRRTPKPLPVIIGSLDGFANGRLHGWICDFLDQGESAYIEVHWRGTLLMRLRANLPRHDVNAIGVVGDPTAPGSLSGGAVSMKRVRR